MCLVCIKGQFGSTPGKLAWGDVRGHPISVTWGVDHCLGTSLLGRVRSKQPLTVIALQGT
jgi:hypothetical protein